MTAHRVVLEPTPRSAQAARRLVRELATGLLDPTQIETAELLVSELVTNAVVHAGSSISLCVEVAHGRLRIEVADESPRQPVVRDPVDPLAVRGRGLQFVEQLSSAWGVEAVEGAGKLVWFELH